MSDENASNELSAPSAPAAVSDSSNANLSSCSPSEVSPPPAAESPGVSDSVVSGQEKSHNTIKDTSIPHGDSCGGDSHIHPYETGATVTDRFRDNVAVHTDFDEQGDYKETRVTTGEKEIKISEDNEPDLSALSDESE